MTNLELRTIYFHVDYDGLVSAAILVSLCRTQAELKGVDYDMKQDWAKLKLGSQSAVVDFLYHPDATVWFDHHGTPFVTPEWQAKYHSDAHHFWDPSAPACPPVIAKHLDLGHRHTEHFANYIYWSEIIDSARYETPTQAHDLTNPHILLSRLTSVIRQPDVLAEAVRGIATQPVETVLLHPQLRPFVNTAIELERNLQTQLASRISYDGKVAFLDQSDDTGSYQRYLPYVFYPDASFVVGIYRKGDAFNVSVGASPWKPAPPIHIGHLCHKWGGGGHPKVGGVTVPEHDDAVRIAVAIQSELERHAS